MATLDENNVEKKFRSVSRTQESIQSLSLWVIHHKAHHEKIVEIWFKVLKKSQIPHRLSLLYLCNDIVQNSKRKHAVVFKDAFKEVLRDAVLLVKDSEIRPNIERIFTIWGERQVYETEFTEELIAILNNTNVRATDNSKLLAEFKPEVLIDKIQLFHSLELELQLRERQLTTLRLDSSNLEAVRQLKDKAHGREFTNQFEECCAKLEEFVIKAKQEVADRTALIEMLEQSELFYDAQFGEAKIVANAYKNFGTRISNLRKKLDIQKARLPSQSFSPVPSPSMDAPSPENSPIMETEDNVESVDMDLSDDDGHQALANLEGVAGWRDSTTTTRAYLQPISSVTNIHMKKSKKKFVVSQDNSPKLVPSPVGSPMGEDIQFDANSSFLPGLAMGAQATFMKSGSSTGGQEEPSTIPTITDGINVPQTGGVTPVKDEGSSTPVQDEHDHEQPDAKPTASVSNPIEFLTQLISQSHKGEQPASSLFKGLSALTQSVQGQRDTQQPWNQWGEQQATPSADTGIGQGQPLVPYQHSPGQADTLQPKAEGSDQAVWGTQASEQLQPHVTEAQHWTSWQNQPQRPTPASGLNPSVPLHQPPPPILPPPTFHQPPPQPPSPQLTIPSTPPVHPPVQHPPPGPPPFLVNFSQSVPGMQPAQSQPASPQSQPPSPQNMSHIPPSMDPQQQQPSHMPTDATINKQQPPQQNWGYGHQPSYPGHSPHASTSSEEFSQQNTPQPLIRPRSIMRQRTLSHHDLDREDCDVTEGDQESSIVTITSNRRLLGFPPRPPNQPPTPQSAPAHLQHRPSEGQQEFIEKLKRKSSLGGTGPSGLPPKPSLNERTLTAIPAQTESALNMSSGDANAATEANGGDTVALAASLAAASENATTAITTIALKPTSEESMHSEHPRDQDIEAISGQTTSPMHRTPPHYHGPPRQEYERRNSFLEEQRNSYNRPDYYDAPPPPRRRPPDPYFDEYNRRRPPPYDRRDSYGYVRPPMKRPLQPPHYERGSYYFRY